MKIPLKFIQIDNLKGEYPRCACFTFKEARKKLKETKIFWEKYNGELTNKEIEIKINKDSLILQNAMMN